MKMDIDIAGNVANLSFAREIMIRYMEKIEKFLSKKEPELSKLQKAIKNCEDFPVIYGRAGGVHAEMSILDEIVSQQFVKGVK